MIIPPRDAVGLAARAKRNRLIVVVIVWVLILGALAWAVWGEQRGDVGDTPDGPVVDSAR